MSNTIKLGKIIYNWLLQDENLQASVSDRIFPIAVTDIHTEMPFIVYSRTGIAVDYNKDGITDESVSVEFVVVARDYEKSVDIANDLRNSLECKSGKLDNVQIDNIYVDSVEEDFIENTYWQILKFRILTK